MAVSRAAKTKKVEVLTRELESSTSAIVGTFSGMTASKDFELRKTVRAAGASYHVVKNKLAAKASQGSKIEAALQGLKGVSAVAYTSGDPVQLAKALSTWVKDNSEFTFKLAIVDGKLLSVEEIGALATMPGKEELFSKLLFLIQSPAQRLATVLNATGRDLAVVLGQGVEKEKFTGAAAAAPVETAAAPSVPAAAESAPAAAESAPAAGDDTPTPENAPADSDGGAAAVVGDAAPVDEPVVRAVEAPAEAAAPVIEAPAASDAAEPEIVAAHAEQAPTPAEQIAEHPASEADPVAEQPVADKREANEPGVEGEPAQPENGTASQAGEAANTDPAEGA